MIFVAAVVVDLAPLPLECQHVVAIVASDCPYSY